MIRKLAKTIKALFVWTVKGVAGKTSWEWLELLIVPLFLAMGAFYLEARVESRQERIAADRYEQEARIADERAKQDVLDNYLEKMQGLLLDRGLRESSEDSEVRSVARAITTTAIQELGAERNAVLINFLQESDLVGHVKKESIALLRELDLRNVNLSGANLGYTNLTITSLDNTNLSDAYLLYADLSNAVLSGTNLSDAYLSNANLIGADLLDADLNGADLGDANLRYADLSTAKNLSEEQLEESALCETKLPEHLKINPNRDCENP